jgi:ATP-dependent Zn protease
VVIGATNFPESLDKALIRPGRFDRHIVVSLPDASGRLNILKLYTKNMPLGKGNVLYI